MVPMQALVLEHHIGNDGKDHERYTLLYDLELYEREGASVLNKPNAVGWHLATILEEGNNPRKCNNPNQRPVGTDTSLLQTKMPIPSKCHKDVA